MRTQGKIDSIDARGNFFRTAFMEIGNEPISLSLEGIQVATQVLNQIEMESSQPFMLRDILPGAAWAPYRAQSSPAAEEMKSACEASEENGNCIRVFVMAVALEGAMALGIFSAWQIWHLIR
jgi:hypothetical protein